MSDTLPEISLVVDQAAIAKYAAITNDFNPIHLDADFAAKTPMKGIIAHGTMSLGLLWQALGRAFDPAELSRLAIDIRFVRPVRIGDTVTAGGRRREGDPGVHDIWVRNQRNEAVIEGTARRGQ